MPSHAQSEIMKAKRGLIMGVANDHSIAWGIAETLAAHGAELAFTYQGEAFGRIQSGMRTLKVAGICFVASALIGITGLLSV